MCVHVRAVVVRSCTGWARSRPAGSGSPPRTPCPRRSAPASMIEMRVQSPMLFGVTFFHVTPPSRVRWMSPSSDPAQISPFTSGDSASAKITPYVSTPVWSFVIGPPEAPSVFGSLRASGGLMMRSSVPRSASTKSWLPPTYIVCRIVRREHDRERPLEPVPDVLGRHSHRVVRPRIHVALRAQCACPCA